MSVAEAEGAGVAATTVVYAASGMPLVRLFLIAALLNVLYLASVLLAARIAGVRVERLGLGFGPKLVDRAMGSLQLEVRLVPLSSWAAIEGMLDDEGPPRGFRALHPVARVGLLLGGWALPLLLAVVLLGPAHALASVGATYGQMVTGLDVREGERLWRVFLALPLVPAAGVLAAKTVAFNLLPLPTLTGGRVLDTLLTWRRPRSLLPAGAQAALMAVGMLALLGGLVMWGRGLYAALRGA